MRTTETSNTVLRLAAQGHLIGERWVLGDAGGTHHHRNPATGEVQADVGLDDGTCIDEAVRVAVVAQEGWAARPPSARAEVLFRWPTCSTATLRRRPSWPLSTTALRSAP